MRDRAGVGRRSTVPNDDGSDAEGRPEADDIGSQPGGLVADNRNVRVMGHDLFGSEGASDDAYPARSSSVSDKRFLPTKC